MKIKLLPFCISLFTLFTNARNGSLKSYSIFNVLGQASLFGENLSTKTLKINSKTLQLGLYFISCELDSGTKITKRFLVN